MTSHLSPPNRAWGSSSERFRNKVVDAQHFNNYLAKIQEGDQAAFKKAVRAEHARAVWEQVAPEEVLEHTERVYLLKLKDKKTAEVKSVMKICVDDSAWAADLDAQKEQYRYLLERKLEEGPLDEVVFKTSSNIIRDRAFKKRVEEPPAYMDDVTPVPLSAQEEKSLEESVSVITDPELREVVKTTRRNDWEWKKGIEAAKRR